VWSVTTSEGPEGDWVGAYWVAHAVQCNNWYMCACGFVAGIHVQLATKPAAADWLFSLWQ
jgi:hypothetical protein